MRTQHIGDELCKNNIPLRRPCQPPVTGKTAPGEGAWGICQKCHTLGQNETSLPPGRGDSPLSHLELSTTVSETRHGAPLITEHRENLAVVGSPCRLAGPRTADPSFRCRTAHMPSRILRRCSPPSPMFCPACPQGPAPPLSLGGHPYLLQLEVYTIRQENLNGFKRWRLRIYHAVIDGTQHV